MQKKKGIVTIIILLSTWMYYCDGGDLYLLWMMMMVIILITINHLLSCCLDILNLFLFFHWIIDNHKVSMMMMISITIKNHVSNTHDDWFFFVQIEAKKNHKILSISGGIFFWSYST